MKCIPDGIKLLKPVAAVGDPPTGEDDRNGGNERPPDSEGEIREEAEYSQAEPEDFALHLAILGFAVG